MNLYCVQDWPAFVGEHHYCVKEIAGALKVHPRTLERFFRAEFHRTPQQWVQRERMKRPRALLREGVLCVKDAATRLAYSGTATFVRAFRLAHKASPRRYLRRLARRRW